MLPARSALAAFAVVVAAACAPAATTIPAPAPAPVPAPSGTMGASGQQSTRLPNDVHWARNSAEHRAIYIEVYRAAGERLQTLVAARGSAGSWGVILDADETILDNSEYERRRVPFGGTYDPAAWTAWVNEQAAPPLPGAVRFATRVHQLGGKVVVVTNRTQQECGPTRANLARVGFGADLVLCKTTTDDKNPRFASVQTGTAAPGFPAITVLEWIGDNIQDFPGLTQAIRTQGDTAFAAFGDTYFALPNPMYGSWGSNPPQ